MTFNVFHFGAWVMNKYGVVTRQTSDALLPGLNALQIADCQTTDEVQAAAIEAGYTRELIDNEYRFTYQAVNIGGDKKSDE